MDKEILSGLKKHKKHVTTVKEWDGYAKLHSLPPSTKLIYHFGSWKELKKSLGILSINLIPACLPCNKRKQTSRRSSAEEEFLHPYFDNIEDNLCI